MSMPKNVEIHWVNGLAPVADAFSGTATSDVVKANCEGVLFLIQTGVGATGTSTFTVLACDDVTPSNTTAVPFYYRENTSTDVWGDWTSATTAGWTRTAGSNAMFQIYVDAAELMEEGYEYVQLQGVEVVDSAVLGGILIGLVNPRYQPQPVTAIT